METKGFEPLDIELMAIESALSQYDREEDHYCPFKKSSATSDFHTALNSSTDRSLQGIQAIKHELTEQGKLPQSFAEMHAYREKRRQEAKGCLERISIQAVGEPDENHT